MSMDDVSIPVREWMGCRHFSAILVSYWNRWYFAHPRMAQIQNYSERKLTFETDELRALSGLARKLPLSHTTPSCTGLDCGERTLSKICTVRDTHGKRRGQQLGEHRRYTYGPALC